MFFLLYGKDFREFLCDDCCKKKSRLIPFKETPTDRPALLANAAKEIPPVIIVDGIRFLSRMPLIILNRFIFLTIRLQTNHPTKIH